MLTLVIPTRINIRSICCQTPYWPVLLSHFDTWIHLVLFGKIWDKLDIALINAILSAKALRGRTGLLKTGGRRCGMSLAVPLLDGCNSKLRLDVKLEVGKTATDANQYGYGLYGCSQRLLSIIQVVGCRLLAQVKYIAGEAKYCEKSNSLDDI